MTGPRRLAVLVGVLAVFGASCQRATVLSEAESEQLFAWLSCEECSEGQLTFIRDSLGDRAREPLRQVLLDLPEEYLEVARRALAASERRRLDRSIDSADYVDYYLAGYEAMLQRRAAVGLAALGDEGGLREALDRAQELRYRPDVVEVIQRALTEADPQGDSTAGGALVVDPADLSIVLGDSAFLGATTPSGVGRVGGSIVWSSEDTAIVSVTPVDGDSAVVLGVTSGVAVVTAAVGPASDSVRVTVADSLPAAPDLVIVSGDAQITDTRAAALGEPLVVRVSDASGTELSRAEVIWTVTRGSGSGVADTTVTGANGETAYQPPLPGVAEITWVEAEALGQRVRFTFRTRAP